MAVAGIAAVVADTAAAEASGMTAAEIVKMLIEAVTVAVAVVASAVSAALLQLPYES